MKLAKYVFVGGRWYGSDDEVPAEVAKRITSPSAWGQEAQAPVAEPAPPREAPKRAPRKTKPREGTTQDTPQAEPSPAPQGTDEEG